MQKVKMTVVTKVPSWHFCNSDEMTLSLTPSKKKCKFCDKINGGYRCILYGERLSSTPTLVDKCPQCIKATDDATVEVVDVVPSVDPKLIIRESIDGYIKTVNNLMAQGYPQPLAETVARKYMLGEN